MAISHLVEYELLQQLLGKQWDLFVRNFHFAGQMSQEIGSGYKIDFSLEYAGFLGISGNASQDEIRRRVAFQIATLFGSAFEHAVIEQTQSSGLVAASTVKMLCLGNSSGLKTFQIRSNNWSSVTNQLSNYTLSYSRSPKDTSGEDTLKLIQV